MLKPEDTVVIGVFNHLDEPQIIQNYLLSLGVKKIISPSKYMHEFVNSNLDTYYLTSKKNEYASNAQLNIVSGLFKDDESIKILKSFVNYQKTGEVSHLRRSATHSSQYLGITLPPQAKKRWFLKKNRWVDVGSFDGDTIQSIRNLKSIKQDEFICIEPDIHNFTKLLLKMKELNATAITLNIALGADTRTVGFASQGESSSFVSDVDIKENFQNSIMQVALDTFAGNWNPTHIKMDIEGFEMQALVGAEKTLTDHRPRISVAVYHKPKDIIEIPIYLSKLLVDYDWHLRTYGAHGYDTVIYGIPK